MHFVIGYSTALGLIYRIFWRKSLHLIIITLKGCLPYGVVKLLRQFHSNTGTYIEQGQLAKKQMLSFEPWVLIHAGRLFWGVTCHMLYVIVSSRTPFIEGGRRKASSKNICRFIFILLGLLVFEKKLNGLLQLRCQNQMYKYNITMLNFRKIVHYCTNFNQNFRSILENLLGKKL